MAALFEEPLPSAPTAAKRSKQYVRISGTPGRMIFQNTAPIDCTFDHIFVSACVPLVVVLARVSTQIPLVLACVLRK